MYMEAFTREWRPEKEITEETFYTFQRKKGTFVKNWQKTKGFRIGAVNGKEIARKIKVSLALLENIYTAFLALNSLSQVITMLLPTEHRMGAFYLEVLWPISGESKEGKEEGLNDLFISAIKKIT